MEYEDPFTDPLSIPDPAPVQNITPKPPAPPTVEPVKPYVPYWEKQQAAQSERLNSVLRQASTVDPVNRAEAQKLSTETGIPLDLIGRNADDIRREWMLRRSQTAEIAKQNPIVAAQLQDREFASISWDDIPNLSATEKTISFITNAPSDLAAGWKRSFLTNEQGRLGNRAQIGTSTPEDMKRYQEIEGLIKGQGKLGYFGNVGTVVGSMADTFSDSAEYGAYAALAAGTTVGVLGQLGPQIALPEELVTVPTAMVSTFWAATSAKMASNSYVIESGLAYMDMIDAGVDRNTAQYASMGVGLVNAGLEVVGFSAITAPIKKQMNRLVAEEVATAMLRPTARQALTGAAAGYATVWAKETGTEIAQEIVSVAGQEMAGAFTKNEFESLIATPGGRKQIAERLVETAIVVGQGMSLVALPGAALTYRADIKAARQAESDQQFIEDLGASVDKSQVRKRNPAAYERFIEAQVAGTPVADIYVNAEQLTNVLAQQGMTIDQLEVAVPGIKQQVEEASVADGDVLIPTSIYAAKIAGTDLGQSLKPHMRVTQDGMSVTEAIEFQGKQEEMRIEAQTVLEAKNETDKAFAQEATAVRQTIYSQIAATGAYTPSVANTYANFVRDFVVTNAAKLGMSPQQFYDKYQYKIVGQQTQEAMAATDILVSEGFVNQATNEVLPTSNAFQTFYGNSVFKNEDGSAQVLYHGTVDSIDSFDLDHPNRKDSGWLGTGVYLTDNEIMAGMYADQKARSMGPKGQQVMPLYARLENPYYATQEEKSQIRSGGRAAADAFTAALKAEGYDGVILAVAPDANEIVVFEPSSVKSKFNDGTWSRETSQILSQQAGQVTTGNTSPQSVTIGDRIIPVTISKVDNRSGESLANVNVAQFEESFQGSPSFYVGPQGEGGIKGRYERFAKFQKTAESIEAPSVAVDKNGSVTFGNGRHRYAFMRDNGAQQMPMAMDAESLANAKKFGYVSEQGRIATNTPAFKNWFGDSQVVGADGNPLVVYHGTDVGTDFVSFDTTDIGSWFAVNSYTAQPYTEREGNGSGRIIPAYLSIKNPLRIPEDIDLSNEATVQESLDRINDDNGTTFDAVELGLDPEYQGNAFEWLGGWEPQVIQAFKDAGFDGISAYEIGEITWAAFEPTQIKSVFNNGEFSTSDANILRQRAAPTITGQSTVEGNKAGLMPHLRVTAAVDIPKGKKPLFAQETKNSTAVRQIAAIDEVLARHPDATSSPEAWTAMMADALATTEVPAPPYAFIENLNGTGSVDLLATLAPGQIQDADQGFANGAAFRDDYINGRISIQDTGRLFLWSFLSRGVSPYTQESLFIDSFYGIEPWITMASEGNFNPDDVRISYPEFGTAAELSQVLFERALSSWETASATIKKATPQPQESDAAFVVEQRPDGPAITYRQWASTTAPKGSGQPGAGAAHNLNAFGATFLVKMSMDAGDGTGRSRMQVLHDMMSDPEATGKAVRRKFLEMGEGVGIDNKVVSFTLLVAGFTDLMVLDRVQIRELWNDGRFDGINLYDGYKDEGKPVAGSAISNLTYGARGLLVYEAIERGLQQKIDGIYAALGRPDAASPGRYHWETWVASSNQEASHATIDAIMEAARGNATALEGVTAKEGEYGAFAYGARYGRNGNGVPYFLYSVPGISDYRFTVAQFREFLDGIKVAGNKIIPLKFKVTESGNKPWYFREGVSLDNLAALAEQLGEKYQSDTISTKNADAGIDPPIANRLAANQAIDGDVFNQQARDAASDLVVNPDGTVTVYHHTNARAAKLIRQSGQLTSAAEPDVYVTTRATADTGYGDTAVPIRVNPDQLNIDDEFPDGRRDYRLNTGRPGGSISVAVGEYSSDLNQQNRGGFDPKRLTTILYKGADYSTFLHETSHFFLSAYADMATMPDATPQMKADMQQILGWFGVEDLQTWNAMPLEEQRQYHEQFAYNYEIYLFEGKAPSVELQSMFQKFTRFLTSVYRSIRDDLNKLYRQENGRDLPILTDEIRSVMDRMLATEDQINQAEQVAGMAPMFQTQEQSGMDDATWAAYQAMLDEAHDQAVSEMNQASVRQVKWLANARSKIIKALQKQAENLRKQVSLEVTEEVKNLPIYRTQEYLKRGLVDGKPSDYQVKLSSEEIEIMFGKGEMLDSIRKKFGFGKYGMLGKETGIHPEQVAEMFGFESAYSMVQDLLNARSMKEEIDLRTDRRMLEENSDLMDERAVAAKAEELVHNEARARFISVELRFMQKSMTPVRVMTAAAKQVAQEIVSGRRIGELKPRDHVLGEAKAARKAQALSKKGEAGAAAKAKQDQLVQNQLAKETLAAKQEVAKALEMFRKIFKSDKNMAKSRNMDLVNAARSILSAFNLGPEGVSPAQFIQKLQEYDPDLYAQVEPLIIEASSGGKDYKMMTMNEFRSMRDLIEALYYQARREKMVEIDGKMMEVEQLAGEMTARLVEIGLPTTSVGEREAASKRDRLARSFNTFKALLRRVEHWADATDGPKGPGVFTKYIWRPMSEATNKYRSQRNDFVKRYVDLVSKLDLKVEKIQSTELNYTFGSANGGIGKAELLGAMLHTGNSSNLRKLILGGRGANSPWGSLNQDGSLNTASWDAFVKRMIDEKVLTKADFDFLQAVWDLNEEMKPIAQKAHKDIFGYYFNEVEATPMQTPFGVYKGGYVPAKVDPMLVGDATRNAKMEELEADFRQSMPSTGMGFTKGRVEYNKALDLDIRKMTSHIDGVLRFANIQPVVKDTLKLLRNKEFSDTLNAVDPGAIEHMLLPWLNRAARQQTSTSGMNRSMDKFWNAVRNRTGIGIMFANLSNALQQLTGYFPALLKVEGTYLKSALWDYMKRPHQAADEVAAMSPFMENRMQNQIFDIQETLNDLLLNPSKFEKTQKWTQKHGYFLQQAFQNQVDVVVWSATYNQTLAQLDKTVTAEAAHKEAISRADAAVRLTQDSLVSEDLSAVQVGSPFYKTLIQFTGYFNMLANLNAGAYIKIIRDMGFKGNKGKLLYTYVMGFGLPMLMADAIVRTLGGQWDDEDDDGYIDEVAEWFFMSQVRGATALIPLVGTAIAVPFNAFNDKPYDDRMSTSPSISTLEAATVGVVKAGLNLADPDKQVTGKNVRDVLTLISLAVGVPVTVLGRPLGYAVDVEQRKIRPTSEADYIRGLISGKASEESRK